MEHKYEIPIKKESMVMTRADEGDFISRMTSITDSRYPNDSRMKAMVKWLTQRDPKQWSPKLEARMAETQQINDLGARSEAAQRILSIALTVTIQCSAWRNHMYAKYAPPPADVKYGIEFGRLLSLAHKVPESPEATIAVAEFTQAGVAPEWVTSHLLLRTYPMSRMIASEFDSDMSFWLSQTNKQLSTDWDVWEPKEIDALDWKLARQPGLESNAKTILLEHERIQRGNLTGTIPSTRPLPPPPPPVRSADGGNFIVRMRQEKKAPEINIDSDDDVVCVSKVVPKRTKTAAVVRRTRNRAPTPAAVKKTPPAVNRRQSSVLQKPKRTKSEPVKRKKHKEYVSNTLDTAIDLSD